jgi:hypothetical protein
MKNGDPTKLVAATAQRPTPPGDLAPLPKRSAMEIPESAGSTPGRTPSSSSLFDGQLFSLFA